MKKLMTLVLVIVALACMPTKAEAARVYDQTGMKATTEEIRETLAKDGWKAEVCRTSDYGWNRYYVYAADAEGSPLCIECELSNIDGKFVVNWANEIVWNTDGSQLLIATYTWTEDWTVTPEGAAYMLANDIEF